MAIESKTVSFGYEEVEESEKTGKVGAVFSSVASKYDVMNDAMSAGTHRLWKDRFVRRVKPRAGETILDMAGGTGDIAFRMVDSGAHITVADINAEMLAEGVDRALDKDETRLVWSQQNAETLNFPDAHFDAYTIVFGIRNVTHIDKALAEAHILPKVGKAVANDEASYRYLAESIAKFPPMEDFRAMIQAAGFSQTKVEPMMGGLVAIHSGWKV